jgi:hypothetical protein
MLSKKLAAIAAISLITASSAAVAQTAQPLAADASARTGTPVAGESNLDDRNGIGIYIVGAVVLGLIIWGIIELTDDDSSDSP